MAAVAVEEFLQQFATDDVRAAVRWLLDNSYRLARAQVGVSDWSASLVYTGNGEVHVGVERSQWYLEVAPAPGLPPIQYDLLVAAQRGHTYWDCFPADTDLGPPGRIRELPAGASWHKTLPDVLAWVVEHDVAEAVARARDQRYVVMWPDSHKAKQLRRSWRRQGLPSPGSDVSRPRR
jgi:hypothetical protein